MGTRALALGCVAGLLLVVAVASCVGDEPTTTSGVDNDATTSDQLAPDANAGDAADDAGSPKCDVNKAFGTPMPMADLNKTGSENYLRLSPDGLTAYFGAVQAGGVSDAGEINDLKDIFKATRGNAGDPFNAGVPLTSINSAGTDDVPTVTGDGTKIFFSSEREGGTGSNDIFVATRGSTLVNFDAPSEVDGVNTVHSEGSPFVRADGQMLYFSRLEVSPRVHDMWRVTNTGGGFLNPTAVTELNVSDEQFPVVSPDDLVIYYASSRPDAGGTAGAIDIWMATRANANDPFDAPGAHDVAELNTANDDIPTFLSADRCTIYLTRRILGADGGEVSKALFVATKTP